MNITDLVATLKLLRKTHGDVEVLVQDADTEGTPVAIAGLDKAKGGVVLRYHADAAAKPAAAVKVDASEEVKPKVKATLQDAKR